MLGTPLPLFFLHDASRTEREIRFHRYRRSCVGDRECHDARPIVRAFRDPDRASVGPSLPITGGDPVQEDLIQTIDAPSKPVDGADGFTANAGGSPKPRQDIRYTPMH
jgi:hypothetical protein